MKISKQKLFWRRSQTGTALVTVLMLITIMTILSAATTMIVLGSQKQTSVQFMRDGQVANVARAGLQAGLSWFKSQLNQPVRQSALTADDDCSIHAAFYPRENTTDILKGDTLDESIGLVKELKVQEPNIYGQYTVKRYDCGQSDTSEWNKHAARDITFKRGKQDGATPGQGVVWFVESEGVLYIKNDPTKLPTETPNKVLQRTNASVEINRVSMSLFGKPVVTLMGGTASSFNNKCEIIGDTETTHGVVRNNGTPNYSGTPLWTIGGATQSYQINTGGGEANKDVLNTFNMSMAELKAVADKVFTNVNEISTTEPIPFGVTFLEGNGTNTFSFDNVRPLKGSGVLFVNGHLTLANDSNSAFSGLIFVTGTITMGSSNSLGGAIMAGQVACAPSTRTTLEYNDNVVNNVRQRLGLYRQNNLTVNIFK
jgi:Tfp pilus assembly protein PilX